MSDRKIQRLKAKKLVRSIIRQTLFDHRLFITGLFLILQFRQVVDIAVAHQSENQERHEISPFNYTIY